MALDKKISHAKEIIEFAVKKYKKIAVACSFGKDSMTTVHLARQVNPVIPVFSIMTQFKPNETFKYLREMNKKMKLGVMVYIVADKVPKGLKEKDIKVKLLSPKKFIQATAKIKKQTNKEIYEVNPDECCQLLKVGPTREAVKNLDAWICGLRNTEGRTRADYQEMEKKGGLMKINPILNFTEEDVLNYLKRHKIPLHPWYRKKFPDGRKYRSLGCAPCTTPIFDSQLERDGRWKNTSKCGGECGIHTQTLK